MIIIGGATATGKSGVAIELAKLINGEIVSADSMQIYKGMDIGTAKETRADVRQHLIDVVTPDTPFTVVDWREKAINAIKDIRSRGKTPIIAGGTGLYIDSLLYSMNYGGNVGEDKELKASLRLEFETKGAEYMHEKLRVLDPETANKVHANNVIRVLRALYVVISTGKPISSQHAELTPYEPFDFYVVTRDRQSLRERIDLRIAQMFDSGLEKEVAHLLENGYDFELQSMQAIGYKEWEDYFNGTATLQDVRELISRNTKAYAKRQETWFNNKKYDYAVKIAVENRSKTEIAKYIAENAKSINNQ